MIDAVYLSGLCYLPAGPDFISNGGSSFSLESDEEATSWSWTTTVGYGPGGTVAPGHPGELRIFYVANAACSTSLWLFYSMEVTLLDDLQATNYLTAGDMDALASGSTPNELYFACAVLGKPPITQPTERPA